MTEQDIPGRYGYEFVKKAAEEAGFTKRQLDYALSEFGGFPENWVNDEGLRNLMNRVGEIDDAESRLVKVEKKDLSSKVVEEPIKTEKRYEIKPKNKKKSLIKNLGRTTGAIIAGGGIVIGGLVYYTAKGVFALPSVYKDAMTKNRAEDWYAGAVGVVAAIYSIGHLAFEPDLEKKLIILGAYLVPNALNGLYHFGKRVSEEMKKMDLEEASP